MRRYKILAKIKAAEYAVILNDYETLKEIIEEVSESTADMIKLRSLMRTSPDDLLEEIKRRYKKSLEDGEERVLVS